VKRAVFLDRDGVITPHQNAPRTLAEMQIDPDAPAVLARLKAAGFLLLVVTNQPDVARGVTPKGEVEAMHAALCRSLPLDSCYVCYHDDGDNCACRKPRPGMLHDAAAEHGIDLAASFLIGDRWRDVDAGAAAGCRTVWIDRGYRERPPDHAPDARATTLAEAAQWILKQAAPARP
jgi:D-glycero-D-manno-heptose 1,7-bisphosphate phosphatase